MSVDDMDADVNELEDIVSYLARKYPGRRAVISELATLLTTTPPPCIHIHSPFSSRHVSSLVHDILKGIHAVHATINSVECFTQRLIFDHALLGLSGWQPQWEDNCSSFGTGRYNSNMDSFLEGLRTIFRESLPMKNIVLVVERAERLKENMPELLVPLTRLAELSDLPLIVILLSDVSWFELRPLTGAALDPFLINITKLPKEDTISALISQFPERETPLINTYSPLLKPLYGHFTETLHAVCSPFLADDYELSYLATACWPNFVSPLLADWRTSESESNGPISLELPSEESRMRLLRYFAPSLTHALEALYPRDQHARQWAATNAISPELRLSSLMTHHGVDAEQPRHANPHSREPTEPRPELTTVAKYVLVAAFLASFNPAKTDIRLIGRAPDERGRKRSRRGVGPRKARGGANARVPQRLLGPNPFPLDRLLAIVGSLMEEHDRSGDTFEILRGSDAVTGADMNDPEVDAEMEVGRVQISATIAELVVMRLLHRTTPAERLDGPPAFKCGITQSRAFELARELGIGTLGDLMWDPS